MSESLDVLVINQNGWWSVICAELKISGYGETEEDALQAFERSFTSTILAKLRTSLRSVPQETSGQAEFPSVQNSRLSQTEGKVVRRVPLQILQKAA